MFTTQFSMKLRHVVAAVLVVGMLGGCASATDGQGSDDEAVNDPIEGFNRYLFEVNMGIDKLVLRPLAEVYRTALPDVVQNAVRNFMDNLRTPVVLVNDLLQGEFSRAWSTLARFGINSTAGGLGLFEVADGWGYQKHNEDFGQTLAVWGTGEGPYLMLPLFGPSNPRDAVGRVVDFFLDPLNWVLAGQSWAGVEGLGTAGRAANMARTGLDAADTRARNIETLDTIEKNSLDFYATVRSLYRQRRMDEINNGKPTGSSNVPTLSALPNPPAKTP
ncbi:MAG: VacJ family lipoprotein [Alphaproteobacteria bacterium]|nr:VacJ family lipoprotein [Alphaproteobacteria bacterium]